MSQPSRVTGPLCNAPVGSGMVTYPCARPQGHKTIPPEDPEPCYAIESAPSRHAHEAWRRRQETKDTQPAEPAAQRFRSRCRVVGCDGELAIFRTEDGASAVSCGSCGRQVGRVVGQPVETRSIGDQLSAATAASRGGLPRDRPPAAEVDEARAPSAPSPVQAIVPWHRTPGAAPLDAGVVRPQAVVSTETEPLRQREGDQPLPHRREDHPGTHAEVIADLEARKRLGLDRYGSLLQPFNGRRFLIDAYEEQLDALVYLRGLIDQAQADRDELIAAAERAVQRAVESGELHMRESGPPGNVEFVGRKLAEVVVDALLESVSTRGGA